MIALIHPARFSFNEDRATEIAAYLIERAGRGGSLNSAKLIKLMYLIDRAALLEWKRPAIGGDYVSMDNGPVLSEAYELIMGDSAEAGPWAEHIVREGRGSVKLAKKPGTGRFTKSLRKIIDSVLARHGSKTLAQIIDHCRKHCGEWKDPAGSSRLIAYESIFDAEDRPGEIEELRREARELRQIERVFGS